MKCLRFTHVVATLPMFRIDCDLSSQTCGMVNFESRSYQVLGRSFGCPEFMYMWSFLRPPRSLSEMRDRCEGVLVEKGDVRGELDGLQRA